MMRTPAVLVGCDTDKRIGVKSKSKVVDKSPANPLPGDLLYLNSYLPLITSSLSISENVFI
jgi:hypothetical protein